MLAEILNVGLAKPKLIAAGAISVVIIASVGYGWWTYVSLKFDLVVAQRQVTTMAARAVAAEKLASDNAAQALKADADRRLAVSALEEQQSEISHLRAAGRDLESEIAAAPESDDGPVAAVLERLRDVRFK
jgi:hypothetical protein